jgi:hypothetical protein
MLLWIGITTPIPYIRINIENQRKTLINLQKQKEQFQKILEIPSS